MYSKEIDRKFNIFEMIFIIVSLVFCIIMLIVGNVQSYDYKLLIILPVAFVGISALFSRVYSYFLKKISATIITSLFFIRMSFIPFLIMLTVGENYSKAWSFINNDEQTIFIIVYEFFCIMLLLFLLLQKKEKNKVIVQENKKIATKNTIYFKMTIAIFCLLALIIYIKYPILKNSIRTLFESTETEYLTTSAIINNMPSILYWIFMDIFDILYMIIPFLIILSIYKNNFSINIKIFSSLIVVGAFMLVATTDKFKSIIMAFSLLMILIYLYPIKRRFIFTILFTVGIGGLFGALVLKSMANNENYGISEFVNTLQLYFSGPFSISVGFEIPDNMNHFQVLINDITSSLAYIKAFFTDSITTTKLYNIAFYQNEYLYDKIIPMISQSAYYFGVVLSPIISCIVTVAALKIENKLEKRKNLFSRYVLIYTVIYLSVSIITYNLSILISGLTGTILPLYIMTLINKRRDKKKDASHE